MNRYPCRAPVEAVIESSQDSHRVVWRYGSSAEAATYVRGRPYPSLLFAIVSRQAAVDALRHLALHDCRPS